MTVQKGGWDYFQEEGNHVVFVPSSYDADLTMDANGESGAVASGSTKIQIANRGATTEDIRVAFGTSAANAISNLTIATGAATTGYYLPAAADGGSQSVVVLGIPATATHYAVGTATASKTQTVSVTQGK